MQFNYAKTNKGGANAKITLSITGTANGQRTTIRTNDIEYPGDLKQYGITFVVPKIDTSVYSDINLEIFSEGASTFVEFQLATDDRVLV